MELEIGPDPAEVGRARRWARSRLAGCGVAVDDPLAETLVLLVSELVTNAVVHATCPAVLSLRLPRRTPSGQGTRGRGTVRVEVVDGSTRPPRRRRAGGDATHGRGLELVDGLADRWGWQPEGKGKRIWCELDPFDAADDPAAAASSRRPVTSRRAAPPAAPTGSAVPMAGAEVPAAVPPTPPAATEGAAASHGTAAPTSARAPRPTSTPLAGRGAARGHTAGTRAPRVARPGAAEREAVLGDGVLTARDVVITLGAGDPP